MKLRSADRRTSLNITSNDPDDVHAGFHLSVDVTDDEGKFQAFNECIHFAGTDWDRLREFLDDRQGVAEIECTEGCRLGFTRWNERGDIGVDFVIGKISQQGDPPKSCETYLAGRFMLDAESIQNLLSDIRMLSAS